MWGVAQFENLQRLHPSASSRSPAFSPAGRGISRAHTVNPSRIDPLPSMGGAASAVRGAKRRDLDCLCGAGTPARCLCPTPSTTLAAPFLPFFARKGDFGPSTNLKCALDNAAGGLSKCFADRGQYQYHAGITTGAFVRLGQKVWRRPPPFRKRREGTGAQIPNLL